LAAVLAVLASRILLLLAGLLLPTLALLVVLAHGFALLRGDPASDNVPREVFVSCPRPVMGAFVLIFARASSTPLVAPREALARHVR